MIWTRTQLLTVLVIALIAGCTAFIVSRRLKMGFWRALALWAMIIYVAVIACATVFFRPVIGGADAQFPGVHDWLHSGECDMETLYI